MTFTQYPSVLMETPFPLGADEQSLDPDRTVMEKSGSGEVPGVIIGDAEISEGRIARTLRVVD